MFWPVVSSTATTLCAFLPMLFWPGVPGQFMGMLPVTLIFVLSASLLVALIYLPVMGGVAGRLSRAFGSGDHRCVRRAALGRSRVRCVPAARRVPASSRAMHGRLNPGYPVRWHVRRSSGLGRDACRASVLFLARRRLLHGRRWAPRLPCRRATAIDHSGYRRTPFGCVIQLIVGNPIMPLSASARSSSSSAHVFDIWRQQQRRRILRRIRARTGDRLRPRPRQPASSKKDALVRQAEDVVCATTASQRLRLRRGWRAEQQHRRRACPARHHRPGPDRDDPWEDRPTVAWHLTALIGPSRRA